MKTSSNFSLKLIAFALASFAFSVPTNSFADLLDTLAEKKWRSEAAVDGIPLRFKDGSPIRDAVTKSDKAFLDAKEYDAEIRRIELEEFNKACAAKEFRCETESVSKFGELITKGELASFCLLANPSVVSDGSKDPLSLKFCSLDQTLRNRGASSCTKVRAEEKCPKPITTIIAAARKAAAEAAEREAAKKRAAQERLVQSMLNSPSL